MFGFSKAQRLCNKAEYDDVFAVAKKIITQEFIILYANNSLGYARMGLALSKKKIAKSYQRNRIKRLLRESFRHHKLPAVDVIILARQGIANVENKLINANLGTAWEKLNTYYTN